MRFAFSDDQLALRDAVRDLLARECPLSAVRAAWASPEGRSGTWAALAEMGVAGMLAPEHAGGLGLDEVDLVLPLEETGRVALAEPVVETAAVAVPLLRDHGDERLPLLASGTATAAVVGPRDELAVWADSAALLVLADDAGVHVVERAKARLEPRTSVDGARRLFFVEAATSERTALPGADPALLLDRGALATAAQLLGLADRMLEMTVEYVRERRQFGVPVGSFQAVKHHLADVRVALEFARPLVYRAAVAVAHDEVQRPLYVSMAKLRASEAALGATRAALQCHGAIGYTTEYDLHLLMKRAWALARSWGDPGWHRRRAGRAILAPDRSARPVP